MFEKYKDQVDLLINVLPYVAEENCFALHGGTAINLFVREMPRLSVDIDLTYIPIEDRLTSIKKINSALVRIKEKIEKSVKQTSVILKKDTGKLFIQYGNSEIKLEVNLTNRGTILNPVIMPLCIKAQIEYEAFLEMLVVPIEQLYGGKLCAALDRQHPRDLFDIKLLLENEGFSESIKLGLLFSLLSSDRPIHELLFPTLLDQSQTLENKFQGMTEMPYTYEEFVNTRSKILSLIHKNLTEHDKQFLIDFESGNPDWSIYDFSDYPGIKWKLQNIKKLKERDPDKHLKLLNKFIKKLKLE